jgi:hypothetical protein
VITLDADDGTFHARSKFLSRESKGDLIGGRAHLFGEMPGAAEWQIVSGLVDREGVGCEGNGLAECFRSTRKSAAQCPPAHRRLHKSEVIVRAGVGGFKVLTIPIDLGSSTGFHQPLQVDQDTFGLPGR